MDQTTVFVISDLHLLDREDLFLFNSDKEQHFVSLCELIKAEGGHLVCAGDIFDLTGLTPCRSGVERFFREAVPLERLDLELIRQVSHRRSTAELLRATQKSFPDFFQALASLAKDRQLSFIPGNHDCAFDEPETKQEFANLLNVEGTAINWQKQMIHESYLIAAHGNEFDPANRTLRGCENRGHLMTSALYLGLMPALRMLGVDSKIVSAVLAVRPEEETISGLEHYLGPAILRKLLIALTRLLACNGYFRGVGRLPAWILNHQVPVLSAVLRATITPRRVRALLPDDARLMARTRLGGRRLRQQFSMKDNRLCDSIVVLGHTHELDPHPDYINLGTWIDHISGLSPKRIQQADRSLPFLVLRKGRPARLLDARGLQGQENLESCRHLWEQSTAQS